MEEEHRVNYGCRERGQERRWCDRRWRHTIGYRDYWRRRLGVMNQPNMISSKSHHWMLQFGLLNQQNKVEHYKSWLVCYFATGPISWSSSVWFVDDEAAGQKIDGWMYHQLAAQTKPGLKTTLLAVWRGRHWRSTSVGSRYRHGVISDFSQPAVYL